MPKKVFREVMHSIHNLQHIAAQADLEGKQNEKIDAEMRMEYLSLLARRFHDNIRRVKKPEVFISYSKKTGQYLFEKAKAVSEEYGFSVNTGFDRPENDSVLKGVLELIEKSAVFLSIMTPENSFSPGEKGHDKGATAPSIWLIEEKGMALALQKPVRLLIQEDVDAEFWKRTTPDKLHSIFSVVDFDNKLEEAMSALSRRYFEITASKAPHAAGGQD